MNKPMRIWVTRPEEDAAGLAEALRAEGIEVLVEPLLRIVYADVLPLDLAGVQALLATSANGVRAFARRNEQRDVQVLAVGDATARAARAAGFTSVESAAGDLAALADLAGRRLDPARGPVLHIAATEVAGDLAGALTAAGFGYRREVLYEAWTADRLSDGLAADLGRGAVDAVLVFSPRTGTTLVRLLRAAGLSAAARQLICFCLSHAVAAAVAPLPWRGVVVAARPTQAAMIAAIAGEQIRLSPESSTNSLSSSGPFAATLGESNIGRQPGDGGMSSETNKDQLPENAAAPAPSEPGMPTGPETAKRRRAKTLETPPTADPQSDPSRTDRVIAQPASDRSPTEPIAADPASSALPGSGAPAVASDGDTSAGGDTGVADADAAPAPPARRSSGFIWALVAFALVAAAGALAYFGYIKPRQQQFIQAQPADLQSEMNAALEDLEARQVRLRQQVEGLAPRVDAIERTLVALRQSVDRLATNEQAVDPEMVKQLGDRIALLETQASVASGLAQQVRSLEASTAVARDTASKLATTVLAVGQLAQAVGDGGPFVRQLAAVRALGGDDPDIAQAAAELEAYATSGVPTLAALRAQLPATGDAVIRATPVTAGETWTDRVMDRLASLVTIRRVGSDAIAAGGVDGIVAQAEAALQGGDLQAAVTALERLDGASAQAASDWLQHARARLAAERALATLQQQAIARLSTARG
jgi:uroporphyrinogen-III synthase